MYLKQPRYLCGCSHGGRRNAVYAGGNCVFITILTLGNRHDGHPRYAHINENSSSKNRQLFSFFPFSIETQGFFFIPCPSLHEFCIFFQRQRKTNEFHNPSPSTK